MPKLTNDSKRVAASGAVEYNIMAVSALLSFTHFRMLDHRMHRTGRQDFSSEHLVLQLSTRWSEVIFDMGLHRSVFML